MDLFVIVSVKPNGYGFLMSTPSSRERTELLLKHTTKCRGEELKIISVDEALKMADRINGVNEYIINKKPGVGAPGER